MYVELREKNKQWMPVTRSLKELWDELMQIGIESEKIVAQMKLPLPEYAYRLLPLVRVQLTGTSIRISIPALVRS
jgi:hypothetical protein